MEQKDQRRGFVSLKPPRLKADGQLSAYPSRSWKTVDSGVCGRGVKPDPFPDGVLVLLQMWSTHQRNHLRKMQIIGFYFHILNQLEEARGGSVGLCYIYSSSLTLSLYKQSRMVVARG